MLIASTYEDGITSWSVVLLLEHSDQAMKLTPGTYQLLATTEAGEHCWSC
ncbi:MAG: hypothetical protein ABR609_07540 [Acidimicrobiia bacterium]